MLPGQGNYGIKVGVVGSANWQFVQEVQTLFDLVGPDAAPPLGGKECASHFKMPKRRNLRPSLFQTHHGRIGPR